MKPQKLKTLSIQPRDFSKQVHFPGTPDNPYHKIEDLDKTLSKLPLLFYAVLLSGLVYLVSQKPSRSLYFFAFVLIDFILLSLLPIFKISFGPPTLTGLILALMRAPFLLFNFPVMLVFQGLGTFMVVYGFYIEPQFPKITTYRVPIFRNGNRPLSVKIVHISDLHMEYWTQRERRVIEQINQLSPDIVFFTGDFFNLSNQHDPDTAQDIIDFFDQIKAKEGIFAVTGSPSVDLAESISKIQPKLKLKLLQDEYEDIQINGQRMRIIGLNCTHHPEEDANRLRKVITTPNPPPSILLYHSPDIAPHIQDLPIDLQLSGHTHGGQVQIPWLGPIYAGSLYGVTFTSGFYQLLNAHYLIISRGIGLEGDAAPRIRFFSLPEVGLISLEIK